MSAISPITIMLVVWGVITAVFVILMIYRSLLSMREEDRIFLDPAEARQEAAQREIITRVERVTPYAKGFGFASLSLLVATGALWVYQAWKAF
jgi:hypothetical protein